MRRVAEQVGLDQAGGDGRRLVAVAAGGGEQGGGVLDQVGGSISRGFIGRHGITRDWVLKDVVLEDQKSTRSFLRI